MKTLKVDAYTGSGKGKAFAGSREIQTPENFTEAIKVYGSEERTLELALRSHVIDVQRDIRSPSKDENTKRFKSLTKEQQDQLLTMV